MFWSFFFKNFANLQVAPEPSSLFFKRKNIIWILNMPVYLWLTIFKNSKSKKLK